MEFDWVMGCGLGWFVGPKFLLCDGLGWVEEIGPKDNTLRQTDTGRYDRANKKITTLHSREVTSANCTFCVC